MQHGLRAAVGLYLAFGVASATAACGSKPDESDFTPDARAPESCSTGAAKCDGNDYLVCDGDVFVLSESCADVCVPELGCVACQPFTGTCNGEVSTMCTGDGAGYIDVLCDPVQGMSCNFETGICDGDCAPQFIGTNYIGCDYYPTITGNEVANNFLFAVAISNTQNQPADITIDGGGLVAPDTFTVAPDSVETRTLPWVDALKACTVFDANGCGGPDTLSAMVPGGGYHLRSTQPVTVYQFNPLDYEMGKMNSFTNDASLLMPTNAMSGTYHVAAWPGWDTMTVLGELPGLMAVTATQDATSVTITTSSATHAGGGIGAFSPGAPQTLTMNAGDVVQLFSVGGDLTGSTVDADKPVQVIGGHFCTNIPADVPACDHIEESMFPLATLGTRYVVTSPAPASKGQIVRIIATAPDTTLIFNPEQTGVPTTLANAGDFVQIDDTTAPFEVAGNHRLLVSQYMQGQNVGGGTGDPAMTLAVPVEQYRTTYMFHAPTNYEVNYVNIIAPLTALITLDGTVLPTNFAPIGNSGWGFTRQTLDDSGTGTHLIESDEQFGVLVYGYGQFTSYWYPAGLDLSPIDID